MSLDECTQIEAGGAALGPVRRFDLCRRLQRLKIREGFLVVEHPAVLYRLEQRRHRDIRRGGHLLGRCGWSGYRTFARLHGAGTQQASQADGQQALHDEGVGHARAPMNTRVTLTHPGVSVRT